MDNRAIVEKLKRQNADIDKIAETLGQQLVNISTIKANNKKIIAELTGKKYLELGETDYNVLTELLNNGFITRDEAETNGVKGLLTWIDKDIKQHLKRSDFNQVVKNVVTAERHGKVKDKIPYIKTSLKRAVEGKNKAPETH